MQTEQRQFTVSPSIIQHLIKSQAGSCGKAVAECVMNSIDAGAARIDITVDARQMIIRDDGRGLRSRDEILQVFEVFGFDHSGHDREYGRFGLGRGQMWNFASTVWRTNGFALDVDIRERGLDWTLNADLPHEAGMTIEARFYEPLTAEGRSDLEREIRLLCRYSAIPVSLNGTIISKDPATETWTHETDDAYIKVTEGRGLKVYNQGIYVREIYAGQAGTGGTLVTKRGANLTLNMARNDILRSECALWKRLHAECKKVALVRVEGKQVRLTGADRDFLAFQSAEPADINNLNKAIFTLSNGKSIGWPAVWKMVRSAGGLISVAESGSRLGEQLLRDKTVLVLAPETLERFGASSVAELIETLASRMEAAGHEVWRWSAVSLRSTTVGRIYEDLKECPAFRELNASKVPESELSVPQKHFLSAVTQQMYLLGVILRANGKTVNHQRKLIVGRAEACDAYTDGTSYIAITEQTVAAAIRDGLPGFLRIMHILVHESLHDSDDSGSHAHDHEFYEAFHEIVLDHHAELFKGACGAFITYTKLAGRMTKKQAKQIDLAAAA